MLPFIGLLYLSSVGLPRQRGVLRICIRGSLAHSRAKDSDYFGMVCMVDIYISDYRLTTRTDNYVKKPAYASVLATLEAH